MSDSGRYARLRAIFDRAVDLPERERGALLDRECGNDAELRADVERLLDTDDRETALAEALGRLAPSPTSKGGSPEDREGEEVGPYRLLRRVGEGGMGVVWEAEQLRPVHRQVALKLVKWGMDTERVVTRFESERQTLARMSHRAIARVFDAGATATGRPYFVMEYVDGVPITQYCDAKRLDIASRIELFLRVCDGVLHAHRKGILHRDLKPSNLLVAEEEGRAVPKIIDFGIAKAVDQRQIEQKLTIELGRVVGTPEYMSPEQAGVVDAEIDTRSDVYSLGVVLYELLSGTLPHDWTDTRSLEEVRRAFDQQATPRPSRRLTSIGSRARSIAERRNLDEARLRKALRGDLDWILLRALEREPDRRYGSVTELADDLQRYLEHRPVEAGPPGAAYRAGKFIRRHRIAVAAGAAVLLALLIGLASTSVALLRARRAEAAAEQEAEVAGRVTDFLTRLFRASSPWEHEAGKAPDLAELLERATAEVTGGGVENPRVGVRLALELALVAVNLDRREDARRLLDRATDWIEQNGSTLGQEQAEILYLRAHLARAEWDFETAESLADAAIEMFERTRGQDDPAFGKFLVLRGAVDSDRGQLDRAATWFRRAVEVYRAAPNANPVDLGSAMADLAASTSDPGERCRLAGEALEIRRRAYSGDHPDVAHSLQALAACAVNRGDYGEAAERYEESHAMYVRALGPGHPTTLIALSFTDTADYFLGRYARIRERGEAGLSALKSESERPFEAGLLHNMLATTCVIDGRFERCREASRRAIALFEASGEFGEAAASVARHTLAELELDAGRIGEARRLYEEVVRYRESTGPDDDLWIPYVADAWARVEAGLGNLERARELALRATAGYRDTSWEPRYRARAWITLATVETMAGRQREAEEAFGQAAEEYGLTRGVPTIHDLRCAAGWHAVNGRRELAIAALRALQRRGVAWKVLMADPLLTSIVGTETAEGTEDPTDPDVGDEAGFRVLLDSASRTD